MTQESGLKYKGNYPLKIKRISLGYDTRQGEECYEPRIFMYLGAIRLDITEYNAKQVELIVAKLELMGLTSPENSHELPQ